MPHWPDRDKQDTHVFPALPSYSFPEYLHDHRLLWADVAHVAGVPAIVVWSIDHGLAVSAAHARMVRAAVETMTGIPFTGAIQVIGEE